MMECDRETLTDLNRAIEQNPDDAKALAQRGETYRQREHFEAALADFDRVIELNPNYAEAIEYYEQGLKDNPDDYLALYGLVSTKICWKGGRETQSQINEARTVLLSVANTEARSVALYGLGGLAALQGEIDQALSYLQEAISLDNYRADTANHDRVWLDLYSDPRFQALLSEIIQT